MMCPLRRVSLMYLQDNNLLGPLVEKYEYND